MRALVVVVKRTSEGRVVWRLQQEIGAAASGNVVCRMRKRLAVRVKPVRYRVVIDDSKRIPDLRDDPA